MPKPHKENEQLATIAGWFRETYPELSELLVFCPRASDPLHKKGQPYGAAEYVLLYPNNGYSALCVQVLNGSERNSDCHKRWRAVVEHAGNKCATIRNLSAFEEVVEEYLENSPYES